MLAFAVLIIAFGLLGLLSLFFRWNFIATIRARGRIALGIMLLFTATRHFTHPLELVAIMPEFIPLALPLVYLSGVLEISGAVGLQIPKLQRWAGMALTLFFVAVFPANINAAVIHIQPPGGLPSSPAYLWLRLLFQPVFIWWALWSSKR